MYTTAPSPPGMRVGPRVGVGLDRGPTAVALLLRDGSATALRPLLPRFVDADGARAGFDGPIWRALRERCIQRAAALPALAEDADARVASGARAVLAYVRQYCRKGRPQQ